MTPWSVKDIIRLQVRLTVADDYDSADDDGGDDDDDDDDVDADDGDGDDGSQWRR